MSERINRAGGRTLSRQNAPSRSVCREQAPEMSVIAGNWETDDIFMVRGKLFPALFHERQQAVRLALLLGKEGLGWPFLGDGCIA